jgi:hypothetical protein
MKIQFLGTGGAFDINYGNSSAILTRNNENILIDCGFTVFPILVQAGLVNQINKVVITHLHDDHVGGLSSLILYYYFKLNLGKLTILYPNENFKNELLNFLKCTTGDPEKYADFVPLTEVNYISPIDTTGEHIENMISFGYAFSESNETNVYSGDLANGNLIFKWLETNQIEIATVFHDICFKFDGVHTFYKDLLPHTKKHRIFGYHCDPENNVKDNNIPLVANSPQFLWKKTKWEDKIKDVEFIVSRSA